MPPPLVSICLPSLNTAPFIGARIESIDAQTVKEVEVVVLDSFSTDGTWETLQQWAGSRERVNTRQIPRGLYQAWNQCVASAAGGWLYFATSDDVMTPNCLERLLAAGIASGADLVTSAEWTIDANGDDLPSRKSGLEARLFGKAIGPDQMLQGRIAFLSGLLFGTPTASITQMAIRRTVFEQGGSFPTEFGSFGDYCWQMKALLRFRWCHVPERLGAWRIHGAQATTTDVQKIYDARARIMGTLWQEGIFPAGFWFKLALVYVGAMGQPLSATQLPASIRLWATLLRRSPKVVRSAWRRLLCLPPRGLLSWLVGSGR
jgi:glycosyltransferase involved in cell wall biosynthesis